MVSFIIHRHWAWSNFSWNNFKVRFPSQKIRGFVAHLSTTSGIQSRSYIILSFIAKLSFPNSLHTSNNFQQSDSLFAEIISQIFQCFIILSNNCVLLSIDHYLDYFNFSLSLLAQDSRSSNLYTATIEIKMISGHFWVAAKFLQNKFYKSLSFNIRDNGSEQTCSKFLIRRKLWTEFKPLAIRGVYASGIGCL